MLMWDLIHVKLCIMDWWGTKSSIRQISARKHVTQHNAPSLCRWGVRGSSEWQPITPTQTHRSPLRTRALCLGSLFKPVLCLCDDPIRTPEVHPRNANMCCSDGACPNSCFSFYCFLLRTSISFASIYCRGGGGPTWGGRPSHSLVPQTLQNICQIFMKKLKKLAARMSKKWESKRGGAATVARSCVWRLGGNSCNSMLSSRWHFVCASMSLCVRVDLALLQIYSPPAPQWRCESITGVRWCSAVGQTPREASYHTSRSWLHQPGRAVTSNQRC